MPDLVNLLSRDSLLNRDAIYELCLHSNTNSDSEIISLLQDINCTESVVEILDTIQNSEVIFS